MREDDHKYRIVSKFCLESTVCGITPLGSGLINDTYLVRTQEEGKADYVLQRINHDIFTDVEMLQHNIEVVTNHLRRKLEGRGISDPQAGHLRTADRHVLRLIPTVNGKTWYFDGSNYWRMSLFIADTVTENEVTPKSSYDCGLAFGDFQAQLSDLQEPLGETIPNFHNMEYRLAQLSQASDSNISGRLKQVAPELAAIQESAGEMCLAERLYRKGILPKRICHCDTKVNNMLFDREGKVICIVDLDTVMPAFIFSDYGDFLRTAASTLPEDSPQIDDIDFRWDIFEAFTNGYLDATASFLTPVERMHLPFAVALFPFMQATRFLTDYLNGDSYYKTSYSEHNLIRARNQLRLFRVAMGLRSKMQQLISG